MDIWAIRSEASKFLYLEYEERSQTKWKWVGFWQLCLRYSRAFQETGGVKYTAPQALFEQSVSYNNRSVGEPAEGSLTSRGDHPERGQIPHLATLVYFNALLLWWACHQAARETLEFSGPCSPSF
jgi:hypothetical protein